MSHYIHEMKWQGKKVGVHIGWDQPLQRFFMYIENLDATDDEDMLIFDNLRMHDPDLPLETWLDILAALGIELPQELTEQVVRDSES